MSETGAERRRTDPASERILNKLDDIDGKMDSVKKNTEVMSVKLFGSSDADKENETGRLGQVERSARSAHKRLDQLTSPEGQVGIVRDKINRWGAVIGAVVLLLELISHGIPAIFKK